MLLAGPVSAGTSAFKNDSLNITLPNTDYADELRQIRMHMPDIEVGNGISFQPKNKRYKQPMRIPLENQVDVVFNNKL